MLAGFFVYLIILYLLYSTFMVSSAMLLMFLAAFVIGFGFMRSGVGFTGAVRNMLVKNKTSGVRLLLAFGIISTFIFFPFAKAGNFFGFALDSSPYMISVASLLGAFIFGIGMQLSGGCASGCFTLAFSGNIKFLVALLFFIIGSTVGAMHFHLWGYLPQFSKVSVLHSFNLGWAITIQLIILFSLYAILLYKEKKVYGTTESLFAKSSNPAQWPQWTMLIIIPVFAFVIFVAKGSTWGITSALATWGAKILSALSLIDVTQYPYWSNKPNLNGVAQPIFSHATSVTNFGLIAGVMLAALLMGKLKDISFKISPWHFASVVIGGFLMGYGARLSGGCNIGALFSGMVIGDLSYLSWSLFALLGNMFGIFLRPKFKLAI